MTVVLEFIKKDQGTFGGDNYRYSDGNDYYIVCVGWALLAPHITLVFKNSDDGTCMEKIAQFDDQRYVTPGEAFRRMGIEARATEMRKTL